MSEKDILLQLLLSETPTLFYKNPSLTRLRFSPVFSTLHHMCWMIFQHLNVPSFPTNKWGIGSSLEIKRRQLFVTAWVSVHRRTVPHLAAAWGLPTIPQNAFKITSNLVRCFRVSGCSHVVNSGSCQTVELCLRGRQYQCLFPHNLQTTIY